MKYSGKGFIAVSAAAALTLSAFCLPAYASEGNWSLPTAGIASLIAVSGSLHEAMPAGRTADLTESEDIAVSPEPETSAGEAADVNASAPEYSAESGEQAETGESAGTGSAASDPLRAGIALLTATNKTSLANEPDAFGSGSVTESALLGITDGGAGETEQAADTAGTVSEAGSGADAAEQAGEIAKQAESQSGEATQQAANAGSIAAAEGASETEESGDDAAEKEQASDAGTSLAVADVSDYVNIRADKSEDAEILGKLYKDGVATVLEKDDGSGWIKITSGSVTGYIKADFLTTGEEAAKKAEESATKVAEVTTETLRVRAAADINSDVITLIPQGDKLNIIEEQDGWYKVHTEDGDGYISSDYADVETVYPQAESKEEEAERLEKEEKKQSEEKAAKSSSKREAVVDYALQFLGNPYVWGGTSLTNGTDCSGFTMSVYAHFGYSLPHYDASQRSCGTAVDSLADALPGDLICYNGHVAIYMGGGRIVHASNPRTGITTGNASYRQIVAIRRIIQ